MLQASPDVQSATRILHPIVAKDETLDEFSDKREEEYDSASASQGFSKLMIGRCASKTPQGHTVSKDTPH
jgi:hypothetical protein